jgi:putative transcriptional regulator
MAGKFVKVTKDMVEAAIRETDWEALAALTDEDIARQVAENPDAAPLLTDEEMLAGRVRLVRKRLGLSQAEFARRFHLSPGTLRDWEQARTKPDAATLAYLRVIEREPEAVMRALAPVGAPA